MIRNLDIRKITARTFGWIQDPSDFGKLKRTVQVLDVNSKLNQELINKIIPDLVKDNEVKDRLIKAMKVLPLSISYRNLVGTGLSKRKEAPCNGIVQAAVPGQRRPYIADWPADNFVRWAHALGFIQYNYESDTFEITKDGLTFSKTENGTQIGRTYICSDEEKKILTEAMLSYPPAVRILNLLSDGEVWSKFEIAKNLGFIGEDGFTRYPQNILLDSLAIEGNHNLKKKLRTDCEGSADKYARMIAGWLERLGLVSKLRKDFNVKHNNITVQEYLTHAYKITNEGLKAVRRTRGINKVERTIKRIHWEMLCSSKGKDRDYIRIRRAIILKMLISSTKSMSLEKIKNKLSETGIEENIKVIANDIKVLINIGINIESDRTGYKLFDNVGDFMIPTFMAKELRKSELSELKDSMAQELNYLSNDYLILIDLAFDRWSNRLFEIKTMELLKECGFEGQHLGGSRKPDGIAFIKDYGIIIDTKAYGNGFSIPITEADKMQRYVEENLRREEIINPNNWWELFPEGIDTFYFMFISGRFTGEFENQIQRISNLTNVKGAVLNVVNLLLFAEKIKEGSLTLEEFGTRYFNNNEIIIK